MGMGKQLLRSVVWMEMVGVAVEKFCSLQTRDRNLKELEVTS